MGGDRELIPAADIQKSSIPFFVSTDKIITTSASPTLASDKYPMNASKVDRADIIEERLDRQKTNRGFYTSEMINPGQAVPPVFY